MNEFFSLYYIEIRKWCCDFNFIIIFIFIYLNSLNVKNLVESTCKAIFINRSKFRELGFETFWRNFETLNKSLWGLKNIAYATLM